MAVLGTFSTFTTARLGIYASQASLQVTGNNIANINTKGYTRQRADLVSLNSTGQAHYANPFGVDIGYGVLVKSTTQVRDPYLDIRYRNENTKLGAVNATLAGLNKISQTLDEVNKGTYQNGVLEDALMSYLSSLRDLAGHVGSEEYDGLVREAASTVTTFFNTAANNLQDDWNLQADELRDTVVEVNKCLTNIRDLNEQIRKQGIYGDLALELRDARNLYIDELSEYLDINVEYSLERLDQYTSVEKLTISLKNTQDPNGKLGEPIKLIDGIYGAQLSLSELEVNPNYQANVPQLPKPNPNYNPNATDGNQLPYLKENGEPTGDSSEAAQVLRNPEFDPNAQYAWEGGKAVYYLNPKYVEPGEADPSFVATNGETTVTNEDGTTTYYYLSSKTGKWTEGTPTPDDPAVSVKGVPGQTGKYLDENGNEVDDIMQAAGIHGFYLSESGKPYGTDDQNDAKKAPPMYLDANGEPTNDPTNLGDAPRLYITDPQYSDDPPDGVGTTTNDPEKAAKVDPNKFLFQVERLEDKFGRPLNEKKTNESVVIPLDDNDLYGSLQAMRELLTEEGEFASRKDVGTDQNMTYSDIRASDPNANIKKGIPYYQKRLDLLAQKFAEVFNEANQLPATTVYETQAGGAGGGTFVKTDANGISIPITKRDGTTSITWDDVTIEVDALDSDGKPIKDPNDATKNLKERIPLDSTRAREALRKEFEAQNPKPTDIEKAIDEKLANAAECLEILRTEGQLKEEYEYYDGGVLFSSNGNTNDPNGITAGNISIANSWAARTVRVLNTKKPDILIPDDPTTPDIDESQTIKHSSESDNINHMISLFEKQLNYSASELEPDASGGTKTFFHGSFQEMYTDLGATLGSATQTITGVANNYEIMTLNMDNNRISVSGVDLNDEATGMMQFQKSYQAACRLLTTIDSMLDTLINGTLR